MFLICFVNGGFPGIILGDSKGGCSGNVIAYNFAYAANTGASKAAGMDISVSHGPHNLMNLVEGNITECMGSDGEDGRNPGRDSSPGHSGQFPSVL